MVVLLDSHLDIEAGVLGKMAFGVGILGTEDRTDLLKGKLMFNWKPQKRFKGCRVATSSLKEGGRQARLVPWNKSEIGSVTYLIHLAKVGRNSHLLGQLGALCQKGAAPEVVDLEDLGAALCRGRLQLWGLDLDEAVAVEDFAELAGNHGPDAEQGLVAGVPEVEDAVAQTGLGGLWGLVVVKGQVAGGVDYVDRVNLDLEILVGCGADRLRRGLESAGDLDERLGLEALHPLDEVGGVVLQDTLDRVGLVAKKQEVEVLGDVALVVYAGAEGDFFALVEFSNLPDGEKFLGVHGQAVPRARLLVLLLHCELVLEFPPLLYLLPFGLQPQRLGLLPGVSLLRATAGLARAPAGAG